MVANEWGDIDRELRRLHLLISAKDGLIAVQRQALELWRDAHQATGQRRQLLLSEAVALTRMALS